ncbi:RecQ family ATP-dependent DNA helicase [Vagococcus zengguangii]|uniref:ATP-dependent DNA helicase RecQ n=1 Tax=Vagococcus zengguangii TaxID=2571750 RepID=A0A4D7CTH0_9ENTE|nr:ATP-dependent DNA helicase RecQ [Vagococcus zengguangii]QCI86483.1 ATP-dependent DNA helicase RecQ [Vagococcus zengguangii]TLG81267.1 ATP-dependent DNA helicase RecQ [Vagococcus zengguangii]
MDQVFNVLKQRFGHQTFRPGQEKTIRAILDEQQVVSVLPTGTGKSLCYQLPSYLLNGQVIIVSPLISLMEDQVRSLIKHGEKHVVAINSQLSLEERQWVFQRLNQYRFIFVTPESLMNRELINRLKHLSISMFVVDEAHCISTWGIDFRPDYERLYSVIKELSYPKVLALTATATSQVLMDIKEKLFNMSLPIQTINTSVNRPNIYYHVEEMQATATKNEWLRVFVSRYQGPGMIYCTTRKDTEAVSQFLKEKTSLKVAYYHGGMNGVERANIQQQFIQGSLDCLVATSAFGMGVDKGNIRYVIHYQLPNSLESYVQESGRAGRDGQQSVSIVLYDENDQRIHHYFRKELENEWQTYAQLTEMEDISKDSYSDIQTKWFDYQEKERFSKEELENRIKQRLQDKQNQVNQMLFFLNTNACRREVILKYFGHESIEAQEICCDNCNEFSQEGLPIGLYGEKLKNHQQKIKKPEEIIKKLFNS